MKKYLFFCSFLLMAILSFGGNAAGVDEKKSTTLVSGKVIDKTSGEEIAGAEIHINNQLIYSDLDGNFTANIDVNNTDAVVKYISYNDTKVKINPFAYNTITIALVSK